MGKPHSTAKDKRLHQRVPYRGDARVCWEDERGVARYAQGKCVDISQQGLRMELAEPIPLRATLSLRAERIRVSGSATVRHVAGRGHKYIVGLNLSQTMEKHSLNLVAQQVAPE